MKSVLLPLPIVIVAVVLFTSCLAELCPDHKQRCRSGQTCCDTKQGSYACCPYANATCCTDGLHCCPSGTSCDLSAGRCRRSRAVNEITLIQSNDVLESEAGNEEDDISGTWD